MFPKGVTIDKILRGKISIIQLKKGFRYGFDAVFLAAFVNGYLRKLKKKNFSLADVGSGVGTISLIIAYHNNEINITAIENNDSYVEMANENILRNNFQKKINLMHGDIFNIDKQLDDPEVQKKLDKLISEDAKTRRVVSSVANKIGLIFVLFLLGGIFFIGTFESFKDDKNKSSYIWK